MTLATHLRHSVLLFATAAACSGDGSGPPGPDTTQPVVNLEVSGRGDMSERYMAEVWVRGDFAYTSTYGTRAGTGRGNAIHVWDVSGPTPVLIDSAIVDTATTLGDVQASDDGRILVVATERQFGSIVIFDLADPRKPRQIAKHRSANTATGVHTAEVARVNGRLYAFLSVDPAPSQLVIVDLTDPQNPVEVLARPMGTPFIHDVFVRDGLLFTALWNEGMTIWDVGGGGRGGSVQNPVQIGNIRTVASATAPGSSAHNIWWYHDGLTGSTRYAFIGEEAPGVLINSSSGDIHVVDVSDLSAPREVAFFHVAGAGTHNFSADEARGVLYAAYYNGGVRAIDVRGDLSACTADQKSPDGRCDLAKMGRELARGPEDGSLVYIWGVHWTGDFVYASDMLNGLWKLGAVRR